MVGRRPSSTKALLTSDWEIPNCRAIVDGLTRALNAARTALTLLTVSERVPSTATP
jgi:hypothetical protein